MVLLLERARYYLLYIGAYIGATSGITDSDALTEKITSLLRDKGMIFNAIAYIIANSCAVRWYKVR